MFLINFRTIQKEISMTNRSLTHIEIPLRLLKIGKVRTIYEIDENKILIVATDRISAFDVVLSNGIPDKGIILTQISNFWFRKFNKIVDNHLIETEPHELLTDINPSLNNLSNRSVVSQKLEIIPFEFIVRGYITGSLWKMYSRGQSLPDIDLPNGLIESQKLPEPIFTPTTKAETGHDEPCSENDITQKIGWDLLNKIKSKSINLYKQATQFAQQKGIIIADTKFEFGIHDGKLYLADEIFTPDSSRFWPCDEYSPGQTPNSYDKQFVRDYLQKLEWNKLPPGPKLPPDIVAATREKYIEAFKNLTGKDFDIH